MHTRSRGFPPARNLPRGGRGRPLHPRGSVHRGRIYSIFRTTCTFPPQACWFYAPTELSFYIFRRIITCKAVSVEGSRIFYGCRILNYSRLPQQFYFEIYIIALSVSRNISFFFKFYSFLRKYCNFSGDYPSDRTSRNIQLLTHIRNVLAKLRVIYISRTKYNKRIYPELIEIPAYMSDRYILIRPSNIPDIIQIICFT